MAKKTTSNKRPRAEATQQPKRRPPRRVAESTATQESSGMEAIETMPVAAAQVDVAKVARPTAAAAETHEKKPPRGTRGPRKRPAARPQRAASESAQVTESAAAPDAAFDSAPPPLDNRDGTTESDAGPELEAADDSGAAAADRTPADKPGPARARRRGRGGRGRSRGELPPKPDDAGARDDMEPADTTIGPTAEPPPSGASLPRESDNFDDDAEASDLSRESNLVDWDEPQDDFDGVTFLDETREEVDLDAADLDTGEETGDSAEVDTQATDTPPGFDRGAEMPGEPKEGRRGRRRGRRGRGRGRDDATRDRPEGQRDARTADREGRRDDRPAPQEHRRDDRPAPRDARFEPRDDRRNGSASRPLPKSEGDGRAAAAPPVHPGPRGVSAPAKRPSVDLSGRQMIINVSGTEECRIAVIHEGQLEELFLERASAQSHVGNIYKGRITNIEPGIQAAFVDFGLPKQGFLHVSDVQPQYFPSHAGASEEVGRKIPRMSRPPIQKCFRRGQEVIVQVTREGVGTKGPTLTTYLSIPGRFLVMMPGMSRHGVSRKIEDEQARRRMRDILNELELPTGMGFILRTAGLDRTKREIQRDLMYLQRLWKTVADRIRNNPAPAELYRESDLVTRTIRDVYSAEFNRMVVDDADTAEKAREFLQLAMPRSKTQVDFYTHHEPIFHRYGVEQEIERINMRHVPLKSGGSLIIESTEAMVTIDVNSGRFRSLDDAEETAYRINMEAAEEIARQLRLRDLGGLILCDFIDMRYDRHIRAVEKKLRDDLRKHKERVRMLRMSAFGIVEMTRQRQRASIRRNMYYDCPHCRGSGVVKMPESVTLDVMRIIQLGVFHPEVQRVTVTIDPDVAMRILNSKRAAIARMETESGKAVVVRGDANFTSDQIECACEDSRGQLVNVGWQMKTAGK